jgi:hypothetical protein
MASAPFHVTSGAYGGAAGERSMGAQIFIWIGWALAAAFWGASMTILAGILRDVGQPVSAPHAPGTAGGAGYLIFVIIAFVVFALSLAYGWLQTSRLGRFGGRGEAATAALYDQGDGDSSNFEHKSGDFR